MSTGTLLLVFVSIVIVVLAVLIGFIVFGAFKAQKYRKDVGIHSTTAPIPEHSERNQNTRRDSNPV